MNESPAFKKMKEEGKTSKAPLTEAFGAVEERARSSSSRWSA